MPFHIYHLIDPIYDLGRIYELHMKFIANDIYRVSYCRFCLFGHICFQHFVLNIKFENLVNSFMIMFSVPAKEECLVFCSYCILIS